MRWSTRWLLFLILAIHWGFAGLAAAANDLGSGKDMRDFPPLAGPNRPPAGAPVPAEQMPPPAAPASEAPAGPAVTVRSHQPEPYRLGVGDELSISVLGEPGFSRALKVRPDGAVTAPGVGTIFVLGRTAEEAGREMERKLDQYLRHPHVDLIVDKVSDHKVYIMGQVIHPGEVTYHAGMTAMQVLAAAGGTSPGGQAGSTLLLRRTGEDEVEVRSCRLTAVLKGSDPTQDVRVEPYDVLYVPATFIGRVDLFVDQYIRQMIAPFTLYVEGWSAFNLATKRVRYVTAQ